MNEFAHHGLGKRMGRSDSSMVDNINSVRAPEPQPKQARLSVSSTVFPDAAVRAIIDEWLIPSVLDSFLRTKVLRSEVEHEHNGEPLP